MQLPTYLERIRHTGDSPVTLDTLVALQKAHLFTVPFENLDIDWEIPIVLDTEKLYKKIVLGKRGGFCYELNGLFHELLLGLGFQSRMVQAQVYSEGKGYGPPFDHMALIVTLEDAEYLADVGFGAFTLAPLKIVSEEVQEDPHGKFRMVQEEEGMWRVDQEEEEGKWIPQYKFDPAAQELKAFDEMCHYHQTSPDSHFTWKSIISKPTSNGRVTMAGNVLKVKQDGSVREDVLGSDFTIKKALKNYFGVVV